MKYKNTKNNYYVIYDYNANKQIIKKKCYHILSAYKLHNPNNEPAYELYYDLEDHVKPQIYKYYINGKLHREDGPAWIEWDKNGNIIKQEYYLNGLKVDELAILVNIENKKN